MTFSAVDTISFGATVTAAKCIAAATSSSTLSAGDVRAVSSTGNVVGVGLTYQWESSGTQIKANTSTANRMLSNGPFGKSNLKVGGS